MGPLPRPSYRQLLVLAFLLVAALLAGTTLNGLFTLERLLAQTRSGADRALALGTAAERLGEQVTTMERSARQYRVLGDPALRRGFDRAAQEAEREVDRLDAAVSQATLRRWRNQMKDIAAQLDAGVGEAVLVDDFRALAVMQATMAEEVRRQTEARNAALQQALDAGDLGALQAACLPALAPLRALLRAMLQYHVGHGALRTRQVMLEVQRLIEPSRETPRETPSDPVRELSRKASR